MNMLLSQLFARLAAAARLTKSSTDGPICVGQAVTFKLVTCCEGLTADTIESVDSQGVVSQAVRTNSLTVTVTEPDASNHGTIASEEAGEYSIENGALKSLR